MNPAQTFLKDYRAQQGYTCENFTLSLLKGEGKIPLKFDEGRKDVRHVMDAFTVMTAESFGVPLDESSDEGTRQHIQGVDMLAIAHSDDQLLGFASVFCPREELMYLHGVAISPVAKGKGVARGLLKSLVISSQMPEMAFTTQNPVMYSLLKAMCERTYPSIENSTVPERFQKRMSGLMAGRSGVFDPTTGIASNLYSKCLYETLPTSSDEEVNRWFASALQTEEGKTRNAFCFVGEGYR